MNIFTTFLLAFGLAMDAFAVAVAHGGAARFRWQEAFKVAALFGFFQALMPVVGWAAGLRFIDTIQSFDHWLAFALLSIVGGKMIYDDLKSAAETDSAEIAETVDVIKSGSFFSLLIAAIATSIDAMAVGFSLTFLGSIITPVVVIGLVTFALSLAGICLGHRFRHFGDGKAKFVGGLILIGIGIKILIEHLSTAGLSNKI
jgi:manganese efflux pump family protein